MADTPEKKRKRLAIIDGKSVFYRGYYAMPNLATKDGTPTGGVFGFATMALEVIKRLNPDYVAVAWDKPKTNIRRRLELYPEYKAGRKPAPPDFKAQIPVLHELLQAFGWPLYELDDYEADDIMGSLAEQAQKLDIETLLVTSDLDMLQLVNERTHVYALKQGLSHIEQYSPKYFEEKYGIHVDQFIDLKALKGDSSDNIPGVPGIGEKGAIQLLQQYGTLDGIYENLALVRDSVRKKLEAGKDLAYLSRQLGAIWLDAPIDLKKELEHMDGHHADPKRIHDLLLQLEFRSLAKQLPEIMQLSEEDAIERHAYTVKTGKNTVIDTDEKVAGLHLGNSEFMYIHSRAAGRHGHNPEVLILSLNGKDTYTLDLRKLDHAATAKEFKDVRPLVGYDVKSTLKVLMNLGVHELPEVGHDNLIGAFLINSLRREQTLTELAQADLGYEGSPFEDLDTDEVIARAPETIAIIKALHQQQVTALKNMPKVAELARNVEWPVIPVLAGMEYEGMLLDTDYLKKFSVEIDDAISDLEQQIYGIAEQEFNIGSPTQLADILFEYLKLPTGGIKKGKTGYSTAASELDKLRGQHPIIDLITQYREVAKLKNTYVDTLPKLVDEHSRVHTTFNLTIAQTGRLSSTDPNLQNIPTRTDLGRHIRTAFVAGKGNKLVSADYSQFELRLAAVMAKDKELIDMFNRGADIHTATAAMVYGRLEEDVTKGMRRAAKVINFGILYGMSPHGLSVATGMTRDQAITFIERYKKVRQPLFDYMDKTRELARKQGYVETLLGRRRPTPDINSSNFVVRAAAERAAINMPIQGTEADLMKMAMIEVERKLHPKRAALLQPSVRAHGMSDTSAKPHQESSLGGDPSLRSSTAPSISSSDGAPRPEAKQLLQVHDSILIECPAAIAEETGQLLKETMENIYKLPVRLDVDVTIADNWGEL